MIRRAIGIGAALLSLVAGTGFASEVDISDLTDGLPTVILSADLSSFTVRVAPEIVVVSGTIPFPVTSGPPTPPIPIGSHIVGLTEPSSDPFNQPVSDSVSLATDQTTSANGALEETVFIQFQSDDVGPVPIPSNAPTLLENGMAQDVSTLLNSSPLTITVASDLATPETPLPASAWSGLALLAGLATWRIVRRRQAQVAVN